ncbi:MAG: hypothetical protein A3I29_00615 [Candidatus Magasanikbacteria bacterium RIFCSPLOWO2_02_FULL_44_11]|uniref:Uncharacterized protein n=2 Tax=Candidatus Magasanikiibacteriota TaxID=1752731 RepID=A0A1F6N907_9BACT|nr:MAG: hypothetical protein A3D53_03800 [Candidatus Magasanikbacteria bacterium RIFCSPHIGHO2_02_FULL_45_10]OGH80437.1 MAG: hypothetical protein A3I29_00615 [Candidatus Magasanikbacteria bacterium RIFCSPLOWO2_02_FULL_44_11]
MATAPALSKIGPLQRHDQKQEIISLNDVVTSFTMPGSKAKIEIVLPTGKVVYMAYERLVNAFRGINPPIQLKKLPFIEFKLDRFWVVQRIEGRIRTDNWVEIYAAYKSRATDVEIRMLKDALRCLAVTFGSNHYLGGVFKDMREVVGE